MPEITARVAFSVLRAELGVVHSYAIDTLFDGTDRLVFLEPRPITEISDRRIGSQ